MLENIPPRSWNQLDATPVISVPPDNHRNREGGPAAGGELHEAQQEKDAGADEQQGCHKGGPATDPFHHTGSADAGCGEHDGSRQRQQRGCEDVEAEHRLQIDA